jgi:ketosteroid isomerase-like protein
MQAEGPKCKGNGDMDGQTNRPLVVRSFAQKSLADKRSQCAKMLLRLARAARPRATSTTGIMDIGAFCKGKQMENSEDKNLHLIRTYLHALQNGEAGDALRRFFTDDVRQVEMPNRLNNRGQQSNLDDILRRSQQGLKILERQQYEIVSELFQGDSAAVEARWTGVLAIAVGTLAAGAEMKASFAMFFHFRDGRIALQRNYDCFDPW